MKKETESLQGEKFLSTLIIPFKYLFEIRLQKSYSKLLSWLILHFFPIMYWVLIFGCYIIYSTPATTFSENTKAENLIIFSISFILFSISHYYLYEFGYIHNDIKAAEKDKMSIRLEDWQLTAAKKYYNVALYSHLLPHIIGFAILLLSKNFRSIMLIPYIVAVITSYLSHILFIIYNKTPYKQRVYIYPGLQILKYVTPIILLFSTKPFYNTIINSDILNLSLSFESNILILLVLLFITYPLEISIERFSMPAKRYKAISKLIPDEESKKRFRINYYIIILIICITTGILLNINTLEYKSTGIWLMVKKTVLYYLPIIILLIYRILILKRVKYHN